MGQFALERFLALMIDQLKRLGEELNLSLPLKLKRKELRLCISNKLSIQGIKSTKKGSYSPCTPKAWVGRQHCPARIVETFSPLTPLAAEDNYPLNENRDTKNHVVTKAFGSGSESKKKKFK